MAASNFTFHFIKLLTIFNAEFLITIQTVTFSGQIRTISLPNHTVMIGFKSGQFHENREDWQNWFCHTEAENRSTNESNQRLVTGLENFVFRLVYGSFCVLKSVIMNHHSCQNSSSFSIQQTLRWNFSHYNVANISKLTADNAAPYIAGGWFWISASLQWEKFHQECLLDAGRRIALAGMKIDDAGF